jgi:hypothetical protein
MALSPALDEGQNHASDSGVWTSIMPTVARSWQREAPRAWQRRLSSREDRPPAAPSWTRPQCPMITIVAVPKRAQAPEDAPSEAGQHNDILRPGTPCRPSPCAQLLARSPQLCPDRTNAKQPNASALPFSNRLFEMMSGVQAERGEFSGAPVRQRDGSCSKLCWLSRPRGSD